MTALENIRDALKLDYAGIDFGVNATGDLLLFEANATMVVATNLITKNGTIGKYRSSESATPFAACCSAGRRFHPQGVRHQFRRRFRDDVNRLAVFVHPYDLLHDLGCLFTRHLFEGQNDDLVAGLKKTCRAAV